jgi:hypothetical protein
MPSTRRQMSSVPKNRAMVNWSANPSLLAAPRRTFGQLKIGVVEVRVAGKLLV